MEKIEFSVHTRNLFDEILQNNSQMAIMKIPLNVLYKLLQKVAHRCAQLNDPELNKLMCRLTMYAMADPTSKDYNKKKLNQILN